MAKINIKGALMKTVAAGAGAVAGASLNKIDMVSKQQPAVRGGLKIALGVMLPAFLGKGKSGAMFADFGAGMIAVGATELANATVFKANPVSISGGPWSELGMGATPIVMAPAQPEYDAEMGY